LCLEE